MSIVDASEFKRVSAYLLRIADDKTLKPFYEIMIIKLERLERELDILCKSASTAFNNNIPATATPISKTTDRSIQNALHKGPKVDKNVPKRTAKELQELQATTDCIAKKMFSFKPKKKTKATSGSAQLILEDFSKHNLKDKAYQEHSTRGRSDLASTIQSYILDQNGFEIIESNKVLSEPETISDLADHYTPVSCKAVVTSEEPDNSSTGKSKHKKKKASKKSKSKSQKNKHQPSGEPRKKTSSKLAGNAGYSSESESDGQSTLRIMQERELATKAYVSGA
ncbi:hypothetical protein OBBRIDRAFT_834734 [Obba rivulosa]|uniref:Uncharacterized protein n=1 Tax=Obba rivulosa TaxID=1052685 RepID=A0A8E2DKU4_9APHY|nr:hypothetical protein OBBRIDRAFT_834734 [Obba rivulosa]